MIPASAMSELQKFNEAANQCIISLQNTIANVEWPPVIYHYTNDAGLRGILESGKLWLTDMFSLNDPSELRHGLSRVVDILTERARSDDSRQFAQMFAGLLRGEAYQKFGLHFVLSFSADGDDLGQWRAYADNGRGYALGFETEIVRAFKSPTGTPIANNATLPVTYDDGKCKEEQDKIVEKMFGLISLPRSLRLDEASYKEYLSHLIALLAMHAFRVALVFKHKAYKNEEEFRFVEIHDPKAPPEIKFRSRPYTLVKYREFDWRSAAPKALKRIVVGPAADRMRAYQFAMDCLSTFHGDGKDVKLFRSGIPYRAM